MINDRPALVYLLQPFKCNSHGVLPMARVGFWPQKAVLGLCSGFGNRLVIWSSVCTTGHNCGRWLLRKFVFLLTKWSTKPRCNLWGDRKLWAVGSHPGKNLNISCYTITQVNLILVCTNSIDCSIPICYFVHILNWRFQTRLLSTMQWGVSRPDPPTIVVKEVPRVAV